MNTKFVQSVSALFLGIFAFFSLIFPDLVLKVLEVPSSFYELLMIQFLGCFYLGFAVMNWNSRNMLIGGVYGRAIYLANLSHYLGCAVILLNWNSLLDFNSRICFIVFILYALFSFVYILNVFLNPKILWKDKRNFGIFALKLKT